MGGGGVVGVWGGVGVGVVVGVLVGVEVGLNVTVGDDVATVMEVEGQVCAIVDSESASL